MIFLIILVMIIIITCHSFAVEFYTRPNGRINLRVNNYNFYKHLKTIGTAYRWSCTFYGSKKRCKAHLIIDENLQVLKANIAHNHIIGKSKKKRKGKKTKPALKIRTKNKVENSNEETEVSSGTTMEITNLDLKQVQDFSPTDALVVLDNKNIEAGEKDDKEKMVSVTEKVSKIDTTEIRSEGDLPNTKIEVEMRTVTATKVTNIEFKQVHDVNSPNALIVLDDDNLETVKNKGIDKIMTKTKTGSKKSKTGITSKEDSVDTNIEAGVTSVMTTEVTNIKSKQEQDVNSPDTLIVLDDDVTETDERKGNKKRLIVSKKDSKIDKTKIRSKKDSDKAEIETAELHVTTTEVTNVEFNQMQDVNSPDAFIILDDDNLDTDNSKCKEKRKKTEKDGSKKDRTDISLKEDSDNTKIKADVPIVTRTNDMNVDLIQVHNVDSPDEPIVLDDD